MRSPSRSPAAHELSSLCPEAAATSGSMRQVARSPRQPLQAPRTAAGGGAQSPRPGAPRWSGGDDSGASQAAASWRRVAAQPWRLVGAAARGGTSSAPPINERRSSTPHASACGGEKSGAAVAAVISSRGVPPAVGRGFLSVVAFRLDCQTAIDHRLGSLWRPRHWCVSVCVRRQGADGGNGLRHAVRCGACSRERRRARWTRRVRATARCRPSKARPHAQRGRLCRLSTRVLEVERRRGVMAPGGRGEARALCAARSLDPATTHIAPE